MSIKNKLEMLCSEFKNFSTCTCFQRAFIQMAIYLRRNYELLFLKYWDFDYRNSCPRCEYIYDVIDYVGFFHGISIKNIELSNSNELNQCIDEYCVRKNMPICLEVDAYYCRWYKEFDKIHRAKYLILWERKDKRYGFIDVSNNNEISYIETENLVRDYKAENCFLFFVFSTRKARQRSTVFIR